MADLKISALTGASTPLAGTEVLPIVQSGSTVKVSVANLTAGRAVGMLSNTINANTATPSAGSLTGTNLWAIGANATNNTVLMDAFGSNNFLAFRRASGTAASPTAIGSGNSIINIGARAYGATGYSSGNRASINMAAAEAWTDTAQGTRIAFNTTPIGSNTLAEGLSLENDGDVKATKGNFVPSAAAKGVNFTANTPAAGMTSQLLNWYEEGTWTPTFTSSGGAFSAVTYNSITGGRYTRVGKIVHIQAAIATDAITIGAVSGNVWIEGLPFAAVANTGSTNNGFSAMSIGYSSNFAASTPTHGYITANQQRIELYTRTTADGASSALNITNLSTTDKNYIYFSAAYICA